MSDLQRTMFGVPSAATPPPGELTEQQVEAQDYLQLWLIPGTQIVNHGEYITLRFDGLRLNLKRWLRSRHGYRVRRNKHYMALRIICYGRHNVESKRRINREWSLAT